MAAVALLPLLAAGCDTSTPVQLTFTWRIAPWGVTDHNIPAYPSLGDTAHYPGAGHPVVVQFDACKSPADVAQFTWTYPGGSQTVATCDGFSTDQLVPDPTEPDRGKLYKVTLSGVDRSGKRLAPVTQEVVVRDLLIVSIGDSVASGEGNPDTDGFCLQYVPNARAPATPCTTSPWWQPQYPYPADGQGSQNPQCHRSTKAAPAQAVMQLAEQHPQVSFTFLHLACSGASITSGLLGTYNGIDPTAGHRQYVDASNPSNPDQYYLDPQLKQVNDLRTDAQGNRRTIDALFITVGANDIHFRDILQDCIMQGLKGPLPGVDCGSPTGQAQESANSHLIDNLAALYNHLEALGQCVTASAAGSAACVSTGATSPGPGHYTYTSADLYLGVPADRIFITGFHDPARGDDGQFCGGYPLSTDAWNWGENSVIAPLNQTVGSVAGEFGWHKVADFNAAPYGNSFLTHGYCSQNTWIRPMWTNSGNLSPAGAPWNAPDDAEWGSYHIQGDHDGYMHPNYWGHKRIADSLVTAVSGVVPLDATSIPPPTPTPTPLGGGTPATATPRVQPLVAGSAGYRVLASGGVTGISAYWDVPSFPPPTASSGPVALTIAVDIGEWNGDTLDGSAAIAVYILARQDPGGQATYVAEYGYVPQQGAAITQQAIPGIKVQPGDRVEAMLSERIPAAASGAPSQWQISFFDDRGDQSWEGTVMAYVQHSDPTFDIGTQSDSGNLLPLPDFAPISYLEAQVEVDGAWQSLFAKPDQVQAIRYDENGVIVAQPREIGPVVFEVDHCGTGGPC